MAGKAIAARLGAVQLLHLVLFDKRLLSDVIAASQSPLTRLLPQDRARAQSLATGVLRNLDALDALIAPFVDTPPPPKVQNVLRLAAYELLEESAAAHGVVNAAVEIIRGAPKTGRLAGLVNAVARKLADLDRTTWLARAPQPLPSWLAKPVRQNFGDAAVAGIAAAHAAGARLDLTLKTPEEAAHGADLLSADILPTGSLRLRDRVQVTALPGFDEGAWWVQDAAAAMPVRLLGDVQGLDVLDLCAAPGGKTMQLAAAGARVTALDQSAARLERLQANLARTGLQARVVTADALVWEADQKFDAVLLDAPCSATGTIRRHPDLPFAKAGADLGGLFDLQAALIDRALGFLKPGGRLVYCTCSLLPREGETQVGQALDRHPGLRVRPLDPLPNGLLADWQTAEGGLRLRPDYWADLGGMDGFYMAVLEWA